MLLINEKQGYTVCLECHEVCRGECTREWLEIHTRHAEAEPEPRRRWQRVRSRAASA